MLLLWHDMHEISKINYGKFSREKSCHPPSEGSVLPKLMGIYTMSERLLDVYAVENGVPRFLFMSPLKPNVLAQKLQEHFKVKIDNVMLKRIARHSTGYHIYVSVSNNWNGSHV